VARVPGEGEKRLRPRDAATLVLVDRSNNALRVLMGRRHAGHKFMPGKFVFPGGAVDPGDRRMAVAAPLDEVVQEKLLARTAHRSPSYARALALAAIRETFEETGLALGVTDHGPPPHPPEGAWTRFAETGVFPTLEGLDFLARAITPPGRPRRFDARFFVADARWIAHRAAGVIHEDAELTELVWVPLDEALKLEIPDITRAVLSEFAALGTGPPNPRRPRKFYHMLRGKRLVEEI
jgi:8-oxo-dGTP pyrophosphatase MutT (NUDIX family)